MTHNDSSPLAYVYPMAPMNMYPLLLVAIAERPASQGLTARPASK